MKKFRGKRRYFRDLSRTVAFEHNDLDFGNEGWFDLWHTHLDFFGVGNNSAKIRREHIKAHLVVYENLLDRLDSPDKLYQSWIELDDEDAGKDAVYIHTPNPNENNFPLKIENLNWDCNIPKYFKDLVNLKEFNVGHYKWECNSSYIIQSKNKGINL